MPRTKTESPPPSWDTLYETAASQGGYFMLGDAIEAGFSPPLLHYHCGSRIERTGRGIYRLRHFPVTEEEELVPLWLWSGKSGVFSHETALQLHNLSDVLPARHHLTVPSSWRGRRLRTPPGLTLHFGDYDEAEVSWHGPVPITSTLRTLRDCAASHVSPEILNIAIQQAVTRGLIDKADLETSATS